MAAFVEKPCGPALAGFISGHDAATRCRQPRRQGRSGGGATKPDYDHTAGWLMLQKFLPTRAGQYYWCSCEQFNLFFIRECHCIASRCVSRASRKVTMLTARQRFTTRRKCKLCAFCIRTGPQQSGRSGTTSALSPLSAAQTCRHRTLSAAAVVNRRQRMRQQCRRQWRRRRRRQLS